MNGCLTLNQQATYVKTFVTISNRLRTTDIHTCIRMYNAFYLLSTD